MCRQPDLLEGEKPRLCEAVPCQVQESQERCRRWGVCPRRIASLPAPRKEQRCKEQLGSQRAGAQAAKVTPPKGKLGKKTTPPKKAPKAKKIAKVAESQGARDGSKTAQVIAMLKRKNGAALAEIMEQTGWQKHTVRGFMAGAMKRAGYAVESFKSNKVARTYRINP